MLKLKQQLLSEARHKKGKPRSAPITPMLERLRQEDHRFEPSLGTVINPILKKRETKKKGRRVEGKGVGLPALMLSGQHPIWELLQANGKSDLKCCCRLPGEMNDSQKKWVGCEQVL